MNCGYTMGSNTLQRWLSLLLPSEHKPVWSQCCAWHWVNKPPTFGETWSVVTHTAASVAIADESNALHRRFKNTRLRAWTWISQSQQAFWCRTMRSITVRLGMVLLLMMNSVLSLLIAENHGNIDQLWCFRPNKVFTLESRDHDCGCAALLETDFWHHFVTSSSRSPH